MSEIGTPAGAAARAAGAGGRRPRASANGAGSDASAAAAPHGLRSNYQWVEAWGMTVRGLNRVLRPRNVEEIRAAFEVARRDGVSLGLRGGGNSYGDASCNVGGHVLDICDMDRVLSIDEQTGVVEAEPGVTIEKLWKTMLPLGFWPKVVSGTMFPALAGALAMNIHGKNNYAVGTIGDNTIEFDIVLPNGELRTCSREQNADLFHAAIGGFGMLGCFSRIKLRTQRVHSGNVWVKGVSTRNLREMMDYFEAEKQRADYLVGWIDAFAGGDQLGRGLIHHANYLAPGEDPAPHETLTVAHQELPGMILGFPKTEIWRVLRLFCNDPGARLVNVAKYFMGRLEGTRPAYQQSHAGFAFLLDYVPNWKWLYGRRPGEQAMIQFQVFLPHAVAHDTYCEILERCRARQLVTYLGVFKRHRPDPFWMTHSVDGWSLAMDFAAGAAVRPRLWAHLADLTDLVLERGGRFYFAKDSFLRPEDAPRVFPEEQLARFFELKAVVDPDGLLRTDLLRRVFPAVAGAR